MLTVIILFYFVYTYFTTIALYDDFNKQVNHILLYLFIIFVANNLIKYKHNPHPIRV